MILLVLIAEILKYILWLPLFIYGFITEKNRSKWYKDLAISKDQYGNVLGKQLFNHLLIKSYSFDRFGNPDETISSVIGKNKQKNTLTRLGKILDSILNFLDKNHSEKSIEY